MTRPIVCSAFVLLACLAPVPGAWAGTTYAGAGALHVGDGMYLGGLVSADRDLSAHRFLRVEAGAWGGSETFQAPPTPVGTRAGVSLGALLGVGTGSPSARLSIAAGLGTAWQRKVDGFGAPEKSITIAPLFAARLQGAFVGRTGFFVSLGAQLPGFVGHDADGSATVGVGVMRASR